MLKFRYAYNMKAKELKKWRLDNGYTQEELSYILGVTVFSVSRWETGTSGIPNFFTLL